MDKLSEDERKIVNLYFENTILEITKGLPREILEETIEYYEEYENYLACAGIKKALDWYDTNTLTKIMLKIEEVKDSIE